MGTSNLFVPMQTNSPIRQQRTFLQVKIYAIELFNRYTVKMLTHYLNALSKNPSHTNIISEEFKDYCCNYTTAISVDNSKVCLGDI